MDAVADWHSTEEFAGWAAAAAIPLAAYTLAFAAIMGLGLGAWWKTGIRHYMMVADLSVLLLLTPLLAILAPSMIVAVGLPAGVVAAVVVLALFIPARGGTGRPV